jgi:hypothetical protein
MNTWLVGLLGSHFGFSQCILMVCLGMKVRGILHCEHFDWYNPLFSFISSFLALKLVTEASFVAPVVWTFL